MTEANGVTEGDVAQVNSDLAPEVDEPSIPALRKGFLSGKQGLPPDLPKPPVCDEDDDDFDEDAYGFPQVAAEELRDADSRSEQLARMVELAGPNPSPEIAKLLGQLQQRVENMKKLTEEFEEIPPIHLQDMQEAPDEEIDGCRGYVIHLNRRLHQRRSHALNIIGSLACHMPAQLFKATDGEDLVNGIDVDDLVEDYNLYRSWELSEEKIQEIREAATKESQSDGRVRVDMRVSEDIEDVDVELVLEECDAGAKPDIKHNLFKDYRRPVTPGEMGCAISHHRVWTDAYERGCESVLILEDDILLDVRSWDELREELKALQALEYEWDIIYLGRQIGPHTQDGEYITTNLRLAGLSHCTHAYMLSNSGIHKLLECGFHRFIFPVDEFLPALYATHPRPDINQLVSNLPKLKALAWQVQGKGRQVRGWGCQKALIWQQAMGSDTGLDMDDGYEFEPQDDYDV